MAFYSWFMSPNRKENGFIPFPSKYQFMKMGQNSTTKASRGVRLSTNSFFIKFLKNFYWSIVVLQCCVSFYCIAKRISYSIHPSPLFFPWTSKRSNQSILKKINPEYSLKGLMLKLHYLGHLMEESTHWKRP